MPEEICHGIHLLSLGEEVDDGSELRHHKSVLGDDGLEGGEAGGDRDVGEHLDELLLNPCLWNTTEVFFLVCYTLPFGKVTFIYSELVHLLESVSL